MVSISRHGVQISIVAAGLFGCGLLAGLPSALADDGLPASNQLPGPVVAPQEATPADLPPDAAPQPDLPSEIAPLPGAATPPAPAAVIPGQPFVEDFQGPAGAPPDPGIWGPAVGTGWDAGVEKYLPENAVLDGDGHLAITAEKSGDGYTSGRVQTKDRVDFGYGTLTARIQVPSGQGLWPAFWLVGADENTNPWPGAGEIDVAEFVSDPNQFHATLHGPTQDPSSNFQQAQITYAGEDFSQDFHDYWMNHEADSVTVGVDGTTLGTFTPASLPPDATWVYNKPFYAILNLAVGGNWAGPPDASTPFPATMLVDSVTWQPS